jgi:hypothetical protein
MFVDNPSLQVPTLSGRSNLNLIKECLLVIPHLPALDCDRGMRNPEGFSCGGRR